MGSLITSHRQDPVLADGARGALAPGAVIERLLRAGLDASRGSIRQKRVMVAEGVDWTTVCAMAHRCRIAPVLYQCFRRASVPVPPDILDWFRVQHYATVARNMALLNELREVLGWFGEASIPTIVLKGVALADLGLGAARVSADLDVLIPTTDVVRADAILRRHGHELWPGPPHDYHRRYGRPAPFGTSVVELHFDISDLPRSHRPDIAGIWDRSRITTISDLQLRVPDLTDHILLTIMQLPHHHWSMRLVVDLWQVALRWGEQVDWTSFLERAASWEMRALARSAVHALWSMFDVPISPAVVAMSSPVGYVERLQWRAARFAIAEQLEHPFRPKVMLIVPFLMVDQVRQVPGMLFRRSLGSGGPPEESPVAKATRRSMAGLAALPAIGKLLLGSFGRSNMRPGWPR